VKEKKLPEFRRKIVGEIPEDLFGGGGTGDRPDALFFKTEEVNAREPREVIGKKRLLWKRGTSTLEKRKERQSAEGPINKLGGC